MMQYAPIITVIVGMAIAFGIQRAMRRKRERQRPAEPKPVRKQWEERNQQMDAQRSADAILVELVETSREISARMDTKIRILNTLIRNAERCIERMEELNTGVTQGPDGKAAHAMGTIPEPEPTPQSSESSNSSTRIHLRPSSQRITVEPSPSPDEAEEEAGLPPEQDDVMQWSAPANTEVETTPPQPEPESSPSPAADHEDGTSQDNHRRVLALQAKGFSVPEIARDVGLSRQEVNIVLHLNRHSRR
ncbi:MAG: hypothetical protein ACYTGH_19325 [Planctomycetota bacterium]|jgi:hypothetical protein